MRKFFATSLLNDFVYNDPEPELVDGLAAVIRKNDYNLEPVMSTLLRSRVFFSPRAYRALVKSPVEFVVGVYRTLGIDKLDGTVLPILRQTGQMLFYPPNVAGWPGGANWITSATMIARQNFLKRIAQLADARAIVVAAIDSDAPHDGGAEPLLGNLARRRRSGLDASNQCVSLPVLDRRRWRRFRSKTTTNA